MATDIKAGHYDYSQLDPSTRQVVEQKTAEIRDRMGRAAQNIVEIGQRLIDVKAKLPHGEFGKWLRDEFAWSERTAQNMMNVATMFKSANFADLTIAPSALYLLANDGTPKPVREQFIERAKSGEKITHEAVKAEVRRVAPRPASEPSPNDAETDEAPPQSAAPAKPQPKPEIDKYPWESFNREVREQVAVVRREVDRLARILGHSGKSFKSKWAYFISADGTIGVMRRALDSIDDNLPGGPHPKEPGFEPYRSVKLRAK